MTESLIACEKHALRILSSYSRFAEDTGIASRFFLDLIRRDERFLTLAPSCIEKQQRYFDVLMKLLIQNTTQRQGAWNELCIYIDKGHMLGLSAENFRNAGLALLAVIENASGEHFSDVTRDAWEELIAQILKRIVAIEKNLGIHEITLSY